MLNFDCSTVKRGIQNIQNDCHQWLSDSFRVHQFRFRPGLRPGPHCGSLQHFSRLELCADELVVGGGVGGLMTGGVGAPRIFHRRRRRGFMVGGGGVGGVRPDERALKLRTC